MIHPLIRKDNHHVRFAVVQGLWPLGSAVGVPVTPRAPPFRMVACGLGQAHQTMGTPAIPKRLELFAVAALLTLLLVQAGLSIERISITTDEHTHIPSGYTYWKTRDFRLNPEHPPLAKLVGGLPLQFRDLSTEQSWPVFERAGFDSTTWDQWVFGDTFLFTDNAAVHDGTVSAARRAVLVFPFILAVCVYVWARMLFGVAGGLIALTLAVFNPDVLAHGRLVNTDAVMAAFYIACPFAFWLYLREPSWSRLALVGLTLGLGLAGKYSNVLLLPVLAVMGVSALIAYRESPSRQCSLVDPFGRGHWARRLGWGGVAAVAVVGVAAFVLWAAYLFAEPPTIWMRGYAEIYRNLNPDFEGFVLGRFHEGRIWSYFLVSFLLKTPLPVIGLALLGVWALWRNPRRVDPVALTALLAAPLILFLAATFKAQPIGHRYILGVYPYLFVVAGAAAWLIPEQGRWRGLGTIAITILLGMSVVAGFRAYPFYLAYHNALVPSDLAFLDYLNDSNNDWGQGWKEVVRQQRRGELGPVLVQVNRTELGHMDYGGRWVIRTGIPVRVPAPGVYALRAFFYQPGWYRRYSPAHLPLIYDHEPTGIIAGSIVLIDVPWPELPERPLGSLEVFESFFPDGLPEQRFHYYFEDGETMRSGPYETFYPDGVRKERGHYYANHLTGPYATFYASGRRREEGVLWRGQLHGSIRTWDESGDLISEGDYLVGERVPELRAWTASP